MQRYLTWLQDKMFRCLTSGRIKFTDVELQIGYVPFDILRVVLDAKSEFNLSLDGKYFYEKNEKLRKFAGLTFKINAKQLMSSIFSTKMISGCSTRSNTVICLLGVAGTSTGSATVSESFALLKYYRKGRTQILKLLFDTVVVVVGAAVT